MKHAGPSALRQLDALLVEVRSRSPLQERTNGVFYHRAQAFLHFHEDPAGLFADLREGDTFVRYPLASQKDRERLLARVDASLSDRIQLGTARRQKL